MGGRWEHFEHGADIGVRGFGPSVAEAFEQAALALTAVVVSPETVAGRDCVTLDCTAPDTELLLVDWLNAIVYEMATRKMAFGRFEVSIDGENLHGLAWGEAIDAHKHDPIVEVKGATMTALAVTQDPGGWVAQCVVDV